MTQQQELGEFVATISEQMTPGGRHGPLVALFVNAADQKTKLTLPEIRTRLASDATTAKDREQLLFAQQNFSLR